MDFSRFILYNKLISVRQNYLYKSNYEDTSHMFALSMNPSMERVGEQASEKRKKYNADMALKRIHAADADFSGNHELGHMLNYDLVRRINADTLKRVELNEKDMTYHITADKLVKEALKKSMTEEEYGNLVRYDRDSTKDEEKKGIYFKKGQVDLRKSGLGGNSQKLGHTSAYGATNAAEFFAEAFADVYQHGKKARKASIELVKAYEKMFTDYEDALPY